MSYRNVPRDVIESLRKIYPVGCRVKLIHMNDVDAPPVGTFGTVYGVDDIGSILVHWDNGSGLNVVFGEDIIVKMNEEEKKQ